MSDAGKILPVVGTVVGGVIGGVYGGPSGAAAGASIGGGLGGGVGAAVTPKPKLAVPTPVTMPDQSAIEAAQRKSLLEQFSRRGRASTILTSPSGDSKLGG